MVIRRYDIPIPSTGSNRSSSNAWRWAVVIFLLMRYADDPVSAAPNPSISWNLTEGSMEITGNAVSVTFVMEMSFSFDNNFAWLPVVTHTAAFPISSGALGGPGSGNFSSESQANTPKISNDNSAERISNLIVLHLISPDVSSDGARRQG